MGAVSPRCMGEPKCCGAPDTRCESMTLSEFAEPTRIEEPEIHLFPKDIERRMVWYALRPYRMLQERYVFGRELPVCHSAGRAREIMDIRRKEDEGASLEEVALSSTRDERSASSCRFVLLEVQKDRLVAAEDFIRVVELLPPGRELGRIWEAYERGNCAFLVLEGSAQPIDVFAPLPEETCAKACLQVLRAVAMLHRRGFVVQHIYPDLIFFDEQKEDAVLAPVGLVVAMSKAQPYVPPEGDAETMEGDLWMVGVVLLYILTGSYAGVRRPEARPGCPLLSVLLNEDPKERGTAQAALAHPWLVRRQSVSKEEVGQDLSSSRRLQPTTARSAQSSGEASTGGSARSIFRWTRASKEPRRSVEPALHL